MNYVINAKTLCLVVNEFLLVPLRLMSNQLTSCLDCINTIYHFKKEKLSYLYV